MQTPSVKVRDISVRNAIRILPRDDPVCPASTKRVLHETYVSVHRNGESIGHSRPARRARLQGFTRDHRFAKASWAGVVGGLQAGLHVTDVSCNSPFMVENSERREELLEKIVDALLADGVSDLSLRPLAEKFGSSARLLIYHFETKENLVRCALAVVRARAQQSFQALAARKRPATLKASLLMFWEWATQDFNQRYFRLLFEVDGLSMHDRRTFADDFRDDGGSVWLQMIDQLTKEFPQNERAASGRSTLIRASLNGLLQDLFRTGDHTRTKAGLHYLIEIIMSGDTSTPKRIIRKMV